MSSTDGPADLLLLGGAVHTVDPARPTASAVAVRSSRVVAVGETADLLALRGPSTRTSDLHGRAVVPGFEDAHLHLTLWAIARQRMDLDSCPTLENALPILAEGSAALPEGAWLQGRGWDRNRWGRLPTAADLDRVVPGRPVALASHDEHALWLNSAALEAAHITANTPDLPDGRVERYADGSPTGVLFERAVSLAHRVMPPPSPDEVEAAVRAALPAAAAAGITGAHSFDDVEAFRVLDRLRRAGDLTLRVYHGFRRDSFEAVVDAGLASGFGDDFLQVGALKLFADGALGSRTAYLLNPYEGAPDYRGILTIDPDQLEGDLLKAASSGLAVAIHAIGDAAVRLVLDCVERVRTRHPGLPRAIVRVEHAQLVDPIDIPRFAPLGVIASMQPIHATADWRVADQQWGDRSAGAYAWRAFLRCGATLAFGTDAPVEAIEPLASLYAAVTRRDPTGHPERGWYPEQSLTLDEAVRAYTIGSAIAAGHDRERGTITPGKLADLVVLSANPFGKDPEVLRETRVDCTIVGGQVVHEL